ncbi:MAG TPA: DUF6781 family protein [Burkholderiaceae bacterium]|nr:DUF6781 family protein [Burkholderiaceae bacterium]
MAKPGFDADALISMFEGASAKQAARLQQAVTEATLGALRGRELTLANIRSSLGAVTQAVNSGLAQNPLAGADAAALVDRAVAGMDEALVKAVQANQAALQQLVDRGVDLREKHLKKALDDLDKFDDLLIGAVRKAAEAAGPLAAPWAAMAEKLDAGGTLAGMTAASTAEGFAAQMQAALKGGRSAGLRAAQVLAESYVAMASGVLTGMTAALQVQPAAPQKAAQRKKG